MKGPGGAPLMMSRPGPGLEGSPDAYVGVVGAGAIQSGNAIQDNAHSSRRRYASTHGVGKGALGVGLQQAWAGRGLMVAWWLDSDT
jgi:hypothetical protein